MTQETRLIAIWFLQLLPQDTRLIVVLNGRLALGPSFGCSLAAGSAKGHIDVQSHFLFAREEFAH